MDFRTYQQFRTYCREDLKEWTDLPGYAEVSHLWWKLEGDIGRIRREAQVADHLHQCNNITPRERAAAELLTVISNHRIISWLREPEPPKGYEREEPLSPEDADAIAKQTIASVTRYAAFLPEREAAVLLADCETFAAATSGTTAKDAPPVALSDWRNSARAIADECFDKDTANKCRDSLAGYSRRVMGEMQTREIHGPRGLIDNPNTIQREALQGARWWKGKTP